MIKILSIFGTRPETIKMAPVVKELESYPEQIVSQTCITAQHREMVDQVLSLFDIIPDYDLDLMQPGQTPTQVAALVLSQLEPILAKEQPDWVLVQGDTTTAMAASVAAFYARIKVGHVEAGLRTYDRHNPFPEEINRKIAGVVADLHFAPTLSAKRNLLQEYIPADHIVVTGNPVIDALKWVINRPDSPSLPLPLDKRLILVTAHRRENFGTPLERICRALLEIASCHSNDVHFVYPVHLSPNVQNTVYRLLADVSNITLLPPLDYFTFVTLLQQSYLVLTDSGGIQEEAPGLGKPVLVLRDATERPEAVEAGTVRVIGTEQKRIVKAVERLLNNPTEYQRMSNAINPYGDGHAAQRIREALLEIQS